MKDWFWLLVDASLVTPGVNANEPTQLTGRNRLMAKLVGLATAPSAIAQPDRLRRFHQRE